MKNKLLIAIFVFSLFFILPGQVKANTINSIDMKINLDDNGNASVVELWDVDLDQGTEGYKPYYNLGVSTITDFAVSDDGKSYQNIGSWNVDASFDDKKFKNGTVMKNNGLELCWGISSYGHHTYRLTYNISNFIYKTSDDYQMLYWTLIPYELSSKPGNVSVSVYSDKLKQDEIKVWAYGKGGAPISYYDGYINVESNGELDSSEYITLLVKIPEDTYNVTSPNLDKSFDEYYKMAEKGARSYSGSSGDWFLFIFVFIMSFGLPIFITIIVVKYVMKYPGVGTKSLYFKERKIKKLNKYDYFRDLPCSNDIFKAYWFATAYKQIRTKTDFLGAILLKWSKNKTITIIGEGKNTSVRFEGKGNLENRIEEEVYDMMYEASGDGILEKKELEKWCSKNYSKILSWFDEVLDLETTKLIQEGKCIENKNKFMKLFNVKVVEVDESLDDIGEQMAGLKRFLKDFSNLSEAHPIEVSMWEEYLMYAQIFGIAKKVAEDFKKIYPTVITDHDIDNFMFIYTVSNSGMSHASSASSSASSGGGGGSFGGGGGGGGFR